jgi:hypothetical protein
MYGDRIKVKDGLLSMEMKTNCGQVVCFDEVKKISSVFIDNKLIPNTWWLYIRSVEMSSQVVHKTRQ